MSKRVIAFLFLLAAAGLIIPLFFNGKVSVPGQAFAKVDPAFGTYINAFTSGVISAESTIKIKLVSGNGSLIEPHKPIDEELFSFEPEIKGKAFWVDEFTIEFRPDTSLPQATFYNAAFNLGKIHNVRESMKEFNFQFKTVTQQLELKIDGLYNEEKGNKNSYLLKGTVYTADVAVVSDIEKRLIATLGSNKLSVMWTHDEAGTSHAFQVQGIERSQAEQKLDIEVQNFDDKTNSSTTIEIPAIHDFKVLDIQQSNTAEQGVRISFSDPIDVNQDLKGLIAIGDVFLTYSIEDNHAFAFTSSQIGGRQLVTVNEGILNTDQQKLNATSSKEIEFNEIKPAVKMIGKGVILPDSKQLLFPFEAVNLKAVDIRVIRIFEKNLTQFFQVNNYDGEEQLKRVGKLILDKTIPLKLSSRNNYAQWNQFSVDLSTLIKTEPGAIYRVSINFKKEYSTYSCSADSVIVLNDILETMNNHEKNEDENLYNEYSYYDDFYDEYSYYEDYDWNQRDNPCHSSYFSRNRSVARNVFASDLGIIAKAGTDNKYFVAISNLITTDPVSNATVEFYDYQQQLLVSTTTSSEGFSNVTVKGKPFLIIVKKNEMKGYLRVDDGSSLSLSNFDLAGESINKGLKGFIYGERGVWRPGDSLYLNFILQDKKGSLPASHPVIFELLNPQGIVINKIVRTESVGNIYNFSTSTLPDAPTGNWLARIKVGGAVFTKNIKIETVMPNRLKLNIEFPGNKIVSTSTGKLTVTWLHGATARNLKTVVEATFSKNNTAFKGYKNFIFDDPAKTLYNESSVLYDGAINQEGTATIPFNIDIQDRAPGILNANITTRVFEEGGSASVDYQSVPYYPFNRYVGIKSPNGNNEAGILYTDSVNRFEVATVDVNGNTVSINDLRVDIYKIEWRWWWSQSGGDLSSYIGDSYHKPFKTEYINSVNGKAKIPLTINHNDWGRYYIRVTDTEGGHSTGLTAYVDWYGDENRSRRGLGEEATMLTFTSNKEQYKIGENAILSVPSPTDGKMLISIENGSSVLQTFWTQCKKGETTVSIPVTADMAPNVYAHITLVQPHAQTKNDLPLRLYGVLPIMVTDPQTHLKPVIKIPAVMEPEKKASITVKEDQGKAMTYTIAIVDEGLLDLTRFKTPDPWNYFYAKEALGVKSWDMYDYVMNAYGGQLDRILSIGGDESKLNAESVKANRFKPMVKFLGPFKLEKNESATHTFVIPQYIGSVRTMIVAEGDNAYGSSEAKSFVKKPLMLLATLPRVLGPGEEVKLPVNIFSDKNVKNIDVTVQAGKLFTVNGSSTQHIKADASGEQMITFDLKTQKLAGVGKVKVIAKSGSIISQHEIEIQVRNPNPYQTKTITQTIDPGKSWEMNLQPFGVAGTNSSHLELSTFPSLNLEKRLSYLITYPHGCIEQTTSSAFPQLFLSDLIDLGETQKKNISNNVKATISRINNMQLSNGGLAYWPGMHDADEWGTNYAGHFILEAEAKGYTVPQGFKQAWRKYQKQRALNWSPGGSWYSNDVVQSYRLYTLALAKSPELGAMNRLKELKNLSIQAKWRLAAAYVLSGNRAVALKLIENISTSVKDYKEMYLTYGSDERDMAMILEALILLKDKRTNNLAFELAKSLASDEWMSTQTTAYSLLAMAKFSSGETISSTVMANYSVNEKASNIKSNHSYFKTTLTGSSGNIVITNTSKKVMYATITLKGVPEAGNEIIQQNNLSIEVNYKTIKGAPIDIKTLDQGTDFIAEISVHHPGIQKDYKQLALSHIVPSGWEIHNARVADFDSPFKNSTYEYQDFRDDRVYTYFDLRRNETKTFRVVLNSSYLGKFYLPSISCEAMYDNSINASLPGEWIEVRKAGVVN